MFTYAICRTDCCTRALIENINIPSRVYMHFKKTSTVITFSFYVNEKNVLYIRYITLVSSYYYKCKELTRSIFLEMML